MCEKYTSKFDQYHSHSIVL